MADLDDFFAKKDRKKSKSSKKFASTPDELVRQIEDISARQQLQNATNSGSGGTSTITASVLDGQAADGSGEQRSTAGDDEWKEFEVEERKDYTGLKIGQLQLDDGDEDGDNYDSGAAGDSDGELNADGERIATAVWKAADPTAPAAKKDAPPPAGGLPAEKGTYVTPAMRNAGLYDPLRRAPLRTNKSMAPDIHDQEYFPELGAAKPEELKKSKRPEAGFEEVRHGGRVLGGLGGRPSELNSNQPVSIGNRFNSLADS